METETQSIENTPELPAGEKGESMAPQDHEDNLSDGEMGQIEQKENKDPLHYSAKFEGSSIEKRSEQMSRDEEMADDAEDGEILEDGEIASDQEGAINEEEEGEEDKSSSNKSSPSKQRSSGHREEHKRRGHDRRERHSKRRRTSKEDSHKEKQKKKHHKDYDYDKSGEDYDSSWSDSKREKVDRRLDSPAHDSHGEERHSSKHDKDGDKRRRGSGESRHKHNRDRGRDRDKSSVDQEKPRDRSRDRHDRDRGEKGDNDRHDRDRGEKGDKKDRDRGDRDSRKGRGYGDGYESPPGIYDSPSDDEYDASRYTEKKPKYSMDEEYMDMDLEQPVQKGKRKQMQKKNDRRRQRNERGDDFEEEAPVKKKPLLQTPMEERPVCRFFKEGKCQRGSECPFNHPNTPGPKRFELCKYHLQSYCRKDGCVFMHEDFPCKYFHTGSTCYQGDNCKFSHSPLTEETDMALQIHLKEREDWEEEFGERKHKKKGLLGDQPHMSDNEIQQKLNDMKSIPSIFDIETHKPGDSPSKPPPSNTQSPNVRPQGSFNDQGGPPPPGPGGPNMRFNGPPNQGGPPQRPPFMGPPGPGMDGPGMNMQGPPPMVSGPNMPGPGLMGPGPAPMMSGPGMPGPGMQGPPMGPPMSQAAALVGAILRAAPMLQQYRQQGPNVSAPNAMQGDPRFMGPNMMGPGPNMDGPNLMVPPPNMGGPIMSPGQDGMMGDMQKPGMMGMGQGQQMMGGQGSTQGEELNQQQQSGQNMGQMTTGSNVRDPRKSGAQNDPRLKRGGDQDISDVDMRPSESGGNTNAADEDFRQDVDMRHDESGSNQGDHTPQQDWDKEGFDTNNGEEDMEIPSHLPPKQREMFMRIRQHTMKMKQDKSAPDGQQNAPSAVKMDDDKWYSSDEEEDRKPDMSNMLTSLNQPNTSESVPNSTMSSSINVMQMINAIKSSNPTSTTASNRPNDPRIQAGQSKSVHREPAMIYSREGECPWRLCRVLYVKQRIPDNIDLNDSKYKVDPRVQKMLKLQELESGKVIDHSKTVLPVRTEMHKSTSEHKLPELLDPRVFKEKKSDTRPELAPFVEPRASARQNSDSNSKTDLPVQRPVDPRLKPSLETPKPVDPRVQRMTSNPGLPSRPSDPRLSRQDSNNPSAINSKGGHLDPRIARQNSRDIQPGSRGSTPPLDPRIPNRQPSEPKIMKLENLPSLPLDLGLDNTPPDPRIAKFTETDSSLQRQISQPGTSAERDAANAAPKPKLDYRNDPRFKRKRISDANLSPDTAGKRFSGQRKSSTEYSSPLGIDTSQSSEESGYNSYNRPRPTQPPAQSRPQATTTTSNTDNVTGANTVSSVSSDVTTHDILDSLHIMPPPAMVEGHGSDKNLKDIFKTIDPTASPFC